MNNNILSMLGLCKRAGMLAVGEEPVEAVARARDARVLLVAGDAAANTCRRVQHFAEAGQCLWLQLPCTKDELGRAVGRGACALVAITDVGFAAAIVHRLADEDPAKYGDAAQRLDLKAKRAAERKAEMQAHEKNLRQGKGRKPAAPTDAPRQNAPAEKPTADRRSDDRRPGGGRPGAKPSFGANRSDDRRPGGGRPGAKPSFGANRSDERRPGGGRPGAKPSFGGKRFGEGRPTGNRFGAKPNPYAHSHPVKKGKGSFRKKDGQ